MTRELRTRLVALAASLVVWSASPTGALAQPQPASVNPALEAFRRGVRALSEQHYDDAVRAFEESCQLGCAPVARYNLGIAHQNLGHVSASVASFERYLATETRFPDPAREPAVRRTIAELRARLATVVLAVTPTTFALLVDGQAATLTDGALTLDPGEHTLAVSASGFVAWRESLRLREGQRVERTVTLSGEPAAVGPSPTATTTAATPAATRRAAPTALIPAPTTTGAPFYTRWWFWTGVAVVAVGAGVTGAVIANENASAEPWPPGATFNVLTIRVE